MARILLLLALAFAPAFGQGKGAMPPRTGPPDIVPPEVTHPDALRDPAHFRREFENSRTRVLRVHLGADELSMLHEEPDGLFVCLAECHVRLVDPSGHNQDIHLQAGETRWVGAGVRNLKNLGTHAVEMLFVEFRSPA